MEKKWYNMIKPLFKGDYPTFEEFKDYDDMKSYIFRNQSHIWLNNNNNSDDFSDINLTLCNNCNELGIYTFQIQLRSIDEGATNFYKWMEVLEVNHRKLTIKDDNKIFDVYLPSIFKLNNTENYNSRNIKSGQKFSADIQIRDSRKMSDFSLSVLFRDIERKRLIECAKRIKEQPDIDLEKLVNDLIPPLKVIVIDEDSNKTSSSSKSTKKKSKKEVSAEDQCSQILSSGENSGKKCSRRKFGDSKYCKMHINHLKTREILTKEGLDVNQTFCNPTDLTEYGENFIDDKNYIYKLKNNTYTCINKLEPDGVKDLTDEDKEYLDKQCFKY